MLCFRPLIRLVLCFPLCASISKAQTPAMFFADSTRLGVPFAKDPSVISFRGRYLMYFSLPAGKDGGRVGAKEISGWGIGIAESRDLLHWKRIGELPRTQVVEKDGIAAPGARVIGGKVHLFYQNYGHGAKDAICHAVSSDGIHFEKDPGNPVYRPVHMAWSVGRAIDAEAFVEKEDVYLFFATRDPQMREQMIGAAKAPLNSRLTAGDWTDVSVEAPLLKPELTWEQLCIEAPSVIRRNGVFYMFYAGAYNNQPQQIGVVRSSDLRHWTRVSDKPLLTNGPKGSWNSSESGHPGALQLGDRTFLFFQGNDDHGVTYHLSKVEIGWRGDVPYVLPNSGGAADVAAKHKPDLSNLYSGDRNVYLPPFFCNQLRLPLLQRRSLPPSRPCLISCWKN